MQARFDDKFNEPFVVGIRRYGHSLAHSSEAENNYRNIYLFSFCLKKISNAIDTVMRSMYLSLRLFQYDIVRSVGRFNRTNGQNNEMSEKQIKFRNKIEMMCQQLFLSSTRSVCVHFIPLYCCDLSAEREGKSNTRRYEREQITYAYS